MNPKERVLTAVGHEEPDRVPVGEWQFGPEVITPVLGREPLFFNGITTRTAFWESRRNEVVSDWKKGLVEFVTKVGWDTVLVHLVMGKNARVDVPEKLDEERWRYKNGAVIQYSNETKQFTTMEGGEADASGPSPANAGFDPDDDELEVVRHVVGELGKTHFIFSAGLSGHPEMRAPVGPVVNEVENWVRLYEDPDKWLEENLGALKSERTARGVEIAKREGMDGVAYGCDFGCNTGPFMSPELFKKAVQPGLAYYAELVHKQGMVMLLHSCGNNQTIMDLIVEAGVDVYQSIQTEMDIVKMKKRHGKNITLWGGVPAGDLILSEPLKVRAEAARYLEECKPGGGYIFGTSHSIMPGAKHENYMAMLDAHKEHGRYRK